ncbi:antitoxin MazE family protein [Rhodoplanes azumiensis]|uniref:Antitoxin MazE family protein n=1 Tax=Rhodoplanes azumiensis TaxID=1897628 RepID=A0ABW5AH78_9BRAD
MPARAKKPPPKSPRQRMQTRREAMRARGLRPVQHWVPDLRDPAVRADILRQGRLLARHSENAAIDAWIDDVYEPDDR